VTTPPDDDEVGGVYETSARETIALLDWAAARADDLPDEFADWPERLGRLLAELRAEYIERYPQWGTPELDVLWLEQAIEHHHADSCRCCYPDDCCIYGIPVGFREHEEDPAP
jgi:hypothetical protein